MSKQKTEIVFGNSLMQDVHEAAKQLSPENKEVRLPGSLPLAISLEELPFYIQVFKIEINGEERYVFLGSPTES